MNKTDPERARYNAPEEESHDIPESAEENRTHKHLWISGRRTAAHPTPLPINDYAVRVRKSNTLPSRNLEAVGYAASLF